MWEKVAEIAATLYRLTDELEYLHNEFSDLRNEMHRLTIIVNQLAANIENNKNIEKLEREKLVLEIKNTLLQFERRLPPP